eukprot:CAMPEP_0194537978 /NCGR_PEP_ID=MMETSP0253-20130528/77409_1 /TAXON_ID=2966 /ORGANISM="Noctiluca scintillans" /LENGTH=48 /DNA_ID= /DNA_START= /DNA_END= /DNA_ORIENTATION=
MTLELMNAQAQLQVPIAESGVVASAHGATTIPIRHDAPHPATVTIQDT